MKRFFSVLLFVVFLIPGEGDTAPPVLISQIGQGVSQLTGNSMLASRQALLRVVELLVPGTPMVGTLPNLGAPQWKTNEGLLGYVRSSKTKKHFTLEAIDPDGQTVFYFMAGGELPPGLSLNEETGVISGDPGTVEGDVEYTFWVRTTDNSLPITSIKRSFTIIVTDRPSCWDRTWCRQEGTMDQFTKCESVSSNGLTCHNPEIRYGTTEGGIPTEHSSNNYEEWCIQLGFSGYSGQVKFGTRVVEKPKGNLFWCSSYDENNPHWCDWQDGNWHNQVLDYQNGSNCVTSITCTD